MKLILLLTLIASGLVCAEELVDPWPDNERSKIIALGEYSHKIKIYLLKPLPIHSRGSGGAEDDSDVNLWRVSAGDHGFVFTSEGDLYIDHLYAGRFTKKDKLHYGFGRIWVNGKPQLMVEVNDSQKAKLYMKKPSYPHKDELEVIALKPWKILEKPCSSRSGAGEEPRNYVYHSGMSVIRVTEDILYVQGICYGHVDKGLEIRIVDRVVSVDGKVRYPVAIEQ